MNWYHHFCKVQSVITFLQANQDILFITRVSNRGRGVGMILYLRYLGKDDFWSMIGNQFYGCRNDNNRQAVLSFMAVQKIRIGNFSFLALQKIRIDNFSFMGWLTDLWIQAPLLSYYLELLGYYLERPWLAI